MKFVSHVIIFVGCFFATFHLIAPFVKLWTYELIEMTPFTSNPDLGELDIQIERIDRGRFGYSGYIDFKVDLNDDAHVLVTLQRSKDREGPFKEMPLNIDNETITDTMNKFYKKMIMDSIEKCCENAPVFKDTFEPPLTKRRVVINKCEISTDGLPSVMMEGYYVLRVTIFAGFEMYLQTLFYIENK